jgi:Ca2+-binding RTX toxin-like protein
MKRRLSLVLVCSALCQVMSLSARAGNFAQGDIVARINTNSVASVTLSETTTTIPITSGYTSVAITAPNCVASTFHPCTAMVQYFRLSFASFVITTNIGTFSFTNPQIVISTDVSVQNKGVGFVVPAGTPADFSATVSGTMSDGTVVPSTPIIQTNPLSSPATFNFSLAPQALTVDGTFLFTATAGAGQTVGGSISVMGSAQTPFLNAAPVAHAGPDQTVSCGNQITLSGSATDVDNNISSYTWTIVNGATLGTGQVIHPVLPAGTTAVVLVVRDAFNAVGTDTVNVTVTEQPPTFASVPGMFTSSTCGVLNTGKATAATSACGPVTVTSNAPASFRAGQTLVTFTATSASGATAQATQQVIVFLGNDPSCCPVGSHIIMGTSNNDTLTGTAGNDCILGLGGQDTINGLGGDDIISGGDGDDIISGGPGNDVISGGTGQDHITGDDGNDILSGDDGDDVVDGGTGDDILFGGQGQDQLICGTGNNQAFGGDGDDTLTGGPGNDILNGGANNNTCIGGGGTDQFISCMTVR